jgi:exopolysaccharide biosynthesis polyprenyl glycosylphosphotransferase
MSVISRAGQMPVAGGPRAEAAMWRRRGWLMRRLLLAADIVGLSVAFAVTELLYGSSGSPDTFDLGDEISLFFLLIPLFAIGAKLLGLYDRDEERTSNTTADDLARVFLLSTTGIFILSRAVFLIRGHSPDATKMTVFWILLFSCVAVARAVARTAARRTAAYVQNTIVVGTDDVGQLIGRKLLQHREYGVNLLGFVDSEPRPLRPDLAGAGIGVLAEPDVLPELARQRRVDRVIFAFSSEPHSALLQLVRKLRDGGVHVDIVPRFFEVVGPKTNVHDVEGVALVGLPPVKIPRSSQVAKRALDVAVATVALLVSAPFFALIALAITLDSPGPVFFRQRRLGKGMREFTVLKFRTMRVDVDESAHRAYIAETMDAKATVGENGLYKLDRSAEITRIGRWLRKTSLDELPQLINVVNGDMSLVGPRPCLPYELEHFEPHHFDRFLVPAGLTGLWQVRARAHATFGEALELDVLYAHSWSLGLDLELLAKTPLQLVRAGSTT